MKTTALIASLLFAAAQANAAVMLTINGNTDADSAGTVTWTFSDLGNDPPTFGTDNGLTPGISGSFTPGSSGSLVIEVDPFTTYDVATNTGTLTGNGLIANNSGLGVSGGQNGGVNAGEAIVFTIDLSGVTPAGKAVELVELLGLSGGDDEVFLNGSSLGASTTISNQPLADGDVLAFTFGGSGTGSTRLTGLTIDLVDATAVIPEPATASLLGLVGVAAAARRRRS